MKKSIRDIEVKGKAVLMRADFNVPLKSSYGETAVGDDFRIRAALPTIRHIIDGGGRLAICAHLGRPKGERKPELSLKPVADRLGKLLGHDVGFVDDCVGGAVSRAVAALSNGEVVVLENTRFHPEEKKNDKEFSKRMAAPFDVFVNDAFGAAHRAHASTVGVASYLQSVQGLLMQEEVEAITAATESPEKPFVVILAGAKISDKIGVINKLAERADAILTGGGIANTFLAARGVDMAESLVEKDALEEAKRLDTAYDGNIEVPVDLVVAAAIEKGADTKIVAVSDVPDGQAAGDIGPQTVEHYREILINAKTVVWNGPVGVFEIDAFAEGTNKIAEILGGLDATVVCGGGDSAAAVRKGGYAEKLTHVSTGGGAFLELIESGSLPGIDALEDE